MLLTRIVVFLIQAKAYRSSARPFRIDARSFVGAHQLELTDVRASAPTCKRLNENQYTCCYLHETHSRTQHTRLGVMLKNVREFRLHTRMHRIQFKRTLCFSFDAHNDEPRISTILHFARTIHPISSPKLLQAGSTMNKSEMQPETSNLCGLAELLQLAQRLNIDVAAIGGVKNHTRLTRLRSAKIILIAVFCLASILSVPYLCMSYGDCYLNVPTQLQGAFRPVQDCDFCVGHSQIARVANIAPEDFERLYAYNARPVIVTDATSNWTALEVWQMCNGIDIQMDINSQPQSFRRHSTTGFSGTSMRRRDARIASSTASSFRTDPSALAASTKR